MTLEPHVDLGPDEPVSQPTGAFETLDDGGTSVAELSRLASGTEPHRAQWQRSYSRNLLVTDVVVVGVAVFVGQFVRFGADLSALKDNGYMTTVSVLIIGFWLVALAGLRTRASRVTGAGIEEYGRVVRASFVTFGAIAIASLLLRLEFPRGYLAIAFPLGLLGLLVGRLVWRKHMAHKRVRGACRAKVLVVGDPEAAVQFAEELTRGWAPGYSVTGAVIPRYGAPRGETVVINGTEVPILGDERYVLTALSVCGADTVAIAGTEHFGVKGIRRLIWDLEPRGVDLMVSSGVMDVALSRLVMRPTVGMPVLHIEKPQYQGAKKFQKRLFDIVFSLAALAAAMPVLALSAFAIKLTSRGPVFYRAERVGMEGASFPMLKFRTMVQDADKQLALLRGANESDGLLFKIRNDPRVTPVGKMLRRLSVDELPQFLNVLRGEMSVVGPRPPLRCEVDAYDYDVSRRLLVKPGITGLWQVSGRSDLSWDESVRLDLSYVDNWSMIGDVLIAAKTVTAVLRRQGAY